MYDFILYEIGCPVLQNMLLNELNYADKHSFQLQEETFTCGETLALPGLITCGETLALPGLITCGETLALPGLITCGETLALPGLITCGETLALPGLITFGETCSTWSHHLWWDSCSTWSHHLWWDLLYLVSSLVVKLWLYLVSLFKEFSFSHEWEWALGTEMKLFNICFFIRANISKCSFVKQHLKYILLIILHSFSS